MSSVFLSHKFTNVDRGELINTGVIIKQCLGQLNHDVFYSLDHQDRFDQQHWSYQQILDYCIEQQQKSDIYLAFINHEEPSTGMDAELAHAITLGQTVVLCIRQGLHYTEFRTVAHNVIEFETIDQLPGLLVI